MAKDKKQKNLNYNFEDQVEPKKRMGKGDFANLPSEPIYKIFPNAPNMRGGIPNTFLCEVEEVSEIYENERGD